MVSLTLVETMVQSVWPESQSAVVALPDPKKGEQIVLLTTRTDPQRNDLAAYASQNGITALAVPVRIFTVDKIPVLGTGKTNYPDVQAMAQRMATGL